MIDTSTVMKVFVGIGAVLAVGIPIFGMGQYVSELRFQMETSKTEVSLLKGQVAQLQDILQKTQNNAASGAVGPRGPKGDKGDPGDQGEPGPRGERGPAGEAIDQSAINEVVEASIAAQLAVLKSTIGSAAGTNGSAFVDTSGGFDLSLCVPASEVRKVKSLAVKVGTEICDDDGALLVQVARIENGQVLLHTPGSGQFWLNSTNRGRFPWDKARTVFLERINDEDGKDALARLRFSND